MPELEAGVISEARRRSPQAQGELKGLLGADGGEGIQAGRRVEWRATLGAGEG